MKRPEIIELEPQEQRAVARVLAALLAKHGTQKAVAARTGIAPNAVSRLGSPKRHHYRVAVPILDTLAASLGVTRAELLKGNVDAPSAQRGAV